MVCADDPGADQLGRTAVERGLTVVRVGESPDAEVRAEDVRFVGSTSTFTVVDRGATARRDHAADPGAALRARRHGGPGVRAAPRLRVPRPGARSRRVQRHPPPDGAQGPGRRRPRLRQLCPPPQRDPRGPPGRAVAGGGGPRHRGLPAAHGLPHPHLRPRHGRRAGSGRRGGGDGRLRRPRGPRARSERRDGGGRRTPRPGPRRLRAVLVGHRRPPGRRGRVPATWS